MEDNIVLINTGTYDKGRIAKEITIINAFDPKIISVDVAFPHYNGDSNDKLLYQALQNSKKLVMPSEVRSEGKDYYGKEIISVTLTCAMEFFPFQHAKAGFVSAEKNDNERIIPKQFIVWLESYTGDIYYHFSIVTAMAFDSLKGVSFVRSRSGLVDVNYKKGGRKFKKFSAADVLNGKLREEDIKGKIVMIGFLGPGNEDRFFSPLNETTICQICMD